MAKSISIGGIQSNTSSYLIALQYQKNQKTLGAEASSITVVLTPDPASASRLKQELAFYCV